MPTLINDWDSKRRKPVVVWGAKCTNCGATEMSPTLPMPKGWEESEMANADGRFPARCPDCRTS